MRAFLIFGMLSVSVAVASCGRSEPPPAPNTVAYYKEHPAERDARIAVCKNDPGTLSKDPDCMNASAAVFSSWGTGTLPPITFGQTGSAPAR